MSENIRETPTRDDLISESDRVTALSDFVATNFSNPAINPGNSNTLKPDDLRKAAGDQASDFANSPNLYALADEANNIAKLHKDNLLWPDTKPSKQDIEELGKRAKAMPDELSGALKATELLERRTNEITDGRSGTETVANRKSILRSDLERSLQNKDGKFTSDERSSLDFALKHYDEIESLSYRSLPMPMFKAIIPNDVRLYREQEIQKFKPVRDLANRISDFGCQE